MTNIGATLLVLLCVLFPRVVMAQTSRFSVEASVGATLIDRGSVQSVGLAFAPIQRLTLLVNAERDHLAFQIERAERGYSTLRGGTFLLVSGEARLALLSGERVSPFVSAGLGGGVSRPNVNDTFPDPVSNDARMMFVGAGVRVPLRRQLSAFGDARMLLATEKPDGIMLVLPIRAGLAWRF